MFVCLFFTQLQMTKSSSRQNSIKIESSKDNKVKVETVSESTTNVFKNISMEDSKSIDEKIITKIIKSQVVQET